MIITTICDWNKFATHSIQHWKWNHHPSCDNSLPHQSVTAKLIHSVAGHSSISSPESWYAQKIVTHNKTTLTECIQWLWPFMCFSNSLPKKKNARDDEEISPHIVRFNVSFFSSSIVSVVKEEQPHLSRYPRRIHKWDLWVRRDNNSKEVSRVEHLPPTRTINWNRNGIEWSQQRKGVWERKGPTKWINLIRYF